MAKWSCLLLAPILGLLLPLRAMAAPPCQLKESPPLPPVALQSIVRGLSRPLDMVTAADGSGRLFIVEQGGTIRALAGGKLLDAPFLDIRKRVTSGGELGLLGLAFHPDYAANHRFFVNYTSSSNGLHTVIAEFHTTDNPDQAQESTEQILLTVAQPFANHKGGDLVFGPDKFLYIGLGDGGSRNDPNGNGQNLRVLLGKMLRVDVDHTSGTRPYAIPSDNPFVGLKGAAQEVWAYGFRNPWRYSFDPVNGFLYLGDVGQDTREEIDVIRKGRNYGWNIMEGSICTPGVDPHCDKKGLDLPIYDYPRTEGTTVIGGYVYRGGSITGLCGSYLYGDFGNGRIWGFRFDGKSMRQHRLLLETHRHISSFGEDDQRELYVVDLDGELLKIVPRSDPKRESEPRP